MSKAQGPVKKGRENGGEVIPGDLQGPPGVGVCVYGRDDEGDGDGD